MATSRETSRLRYLVTDTPPWHMSLLVGLQHYMIMFSGIMMITPVLAPALCMETDYVAIGEVGATLLFVSGLITMMQTTLGVRLPMVQGGSLIFLASSYSVLSSPKWACPDGRESLTSANSSTVTESYWNNATINGTLEIPVASLHHAKIWPSRMRELQGAFIGASLVEVFIGLSGLTGVIMRYVGPLCICPTIMLIGLSLYKPALGMCSKHWGISSMTIVLVVIFSQYLESLRVPVPVCSKKKQCCRVKKKPIFGYFSILAALLVSWLICLVLTLTNVLASDPSTSGYTARTDTKLSGLQSAHWFRIPYPFQWGMPTVRFTGALTMLSVLFAGIIDSVGDYFVAARMSGAPPPTDSAVNRGIFIEGVGILLSGIFGTGNATATYGGNIGALTMTKVGSRRVIQVCAVFMMLFGIFGKFNALFVSVPDPIIGGIMITTSSSIIAGSITLLHYVDVNSSRNVFIIGFSLMMGLSIPDWMRENASQIDTGREMLDQTVIVLLSNHMLIGGFISCLLDNTLPGSQEERGIADFLADSSAVNSTHDDDFLSKCYDLPFGMTFIRRWGWTRYIPISPTFKFDRVASGKSIPVDSDTLNEERIQLDTGATDGINGKHTETLSASFVL